MGDESTAEPSPLAGRRVVVTRARDQAAELTELLRERGAHSVEIPTIATTPPNDGGEALRSAVAAVSGYDWVILTSANGAARFCAELVAGALDGVAIAAIGPGTARVVTEQGFEVDLIPEAYVGEGLLDVFPRPPAEGGKVLLARAARARNVVPEGLAEAGWHVDVVAAYQTVTAEIDSADIVRLSESDVVTFTSASTVRSLVEQVGVDGVPPVVACIGPVTAQAARDAGLTVDIEPSEHTLRELVLAIEAFFGSE